jgi:hypothetical protein
MTRNEVGTMNHNFTGQMLLDDARRLTVDAERLSHVVELVEYLDRRVGDPDSRRVIRQLREMRTRNEELARRLKLVAMELQDPHERDRVRRLDEVMEAYSNERAATFEAMGGGA